MPDDAVAPRLACVDCGYSLSGLSGSGACPECGKSVAESLAIARVATTARSRSGSSALIASTTASVLLIVALIAAGAGVALSNARPLVACVAPIALFSHLCFVAGAGSWLANDDTDVRRGRLERLVGVLAVVVLIGSLTLPLIGAFVSAPNGAPFMAVAGAIAALWGALYLVLHALIAALFGRFAMRLQEPRLAWCFRATGVAETIAAASLLLFGVVGALRPTSTPRSPMWPVFEWGMILSLVICLFAHSVSQIVLFVSGILLRARAKRARMDA